MDLQVKDLGAWYTLEDTHPNRLLQQAPDLEMTFEGNSLYKGYANGDALLTWNANEVDFGRGEYCVDPEIPNVMPFEKIYTTCLKRRTVLSQATRFLWSTIHLKNKG